MPRELLVAAVLLIPGMSLAGQSVAWVGYGHNSDQATGLAADENINVGYLLARGRAGATATVGLPVDATVGTRWGAVAGWIDHSVGTTRWRVGAGGSLFAFDDQVIEGTGAGSTLWLTTERPIRTSPVDLRIRLGGRHGWRSRAGESSSRALGRAGLGASTRARSVVVTGALDHWRAEEDGYTQASTHVGLYQPRFQLWGSLGYWLDEELEGTGWDLGARVSMSERVSIIARGGVQATDVLFWIPRQRTWSIGLQVRTGHVPTIAALPVPVLRDGRRSITLTLPAARLREPSVAGTFSDWQSLPMRRVDDRWEIDLVLEPGIHEYSFVTADGDWFVPEGTPGRKPDGFGGHVAVIIVE